MKRIDALLTGLGAVVTLLSGAVVLGVAWRAFIWAAGL